MFGYIRPCKAELRMKEFEAFRAVYCGLCHQLGRSFGPFARLTLNYDFVFLAMLRYAQEDSPPQITRGRCAVNALKRVPVCKADEALAFTADAAALMLYYSLLDKIADGNFPQKAGYSLLRPFAAAARGQAAKRSPETEALMRGLFENQRAVEAGENPGLDAAAEPTAAALSGLFGLLTRNSGQKRVLGRLGYLTGRYIYLCDALDDLEADLKAGAFNPLTARCGNRAGQELRDVYEYARQSLFMTIGEAGLACGLLEMKSFAPVIENIVYLGMAEQVDRICEKWTSGEKIAGHL